jgi:hypothetical protein
MVSVMFTDVRGISQKKEVYFVRLLDVFLIWKFLQREIRDWGRDGL